MSEPDQESVSLYRNSVAFSHVVEWMRQVMRNTTVDAQSLRRAVNMAEELEIRRQLENPGVNGQGRPSERILGHPVRPIFRNMVEITQNRPK